MLIRISEMLLRHTRDTDIVGRLGGDEFGIVLAQATAADSLLKAKLLAREVDQLVGRNGHDSNGRTVRIGASCGVVEWQVGQDAQTLIALADQAMFAQKARRKSSLQADKQ